MRAGTGTSECTRSRARCPDPISVNSFARACACDCRACDFRCVRGFARVRVCSCGVLCGITTNRAKWQCCNIILAFIDRVGHQSVACSVLPGCCFGDTVCVCCVFACTHAYAGAKINPKHVERNCSHTNAHALFAPNVLHACWRGLRMRIHLNTLRFSRTCDGVVYWCAGPARARITITQYVMNRVCVGALLKPITSVWLGARSFMLTGRELVAMRKRAAHSTCVCVCVFCLTIYSRGVILDKLCNI